MSRSSSRRARRVQFSIKASDESGSKPREHQNHQSSQKRRPRKEKRKKRQKTASEDSQATMDLQPDSGRDKKLSLVSEHRIVFHEVPNSSRTDKIVNLEAPPTETETLNLTDKEGTSIELRELQDTDSFSTERKFGEIMSKKSKKGKNLSGSIGGFSELQSQIKLDQSSEKRLEGTVVTSYLSNGSIPAGKGSPDSLNNLTKKSTKLDLYRERRIPVGEQSVFSAVNFGQKRSPLSRGGRSVIFFKNNFEIKRLSFAKKTEIKEKGGSKDKPQRLAQCKEQVRCPQNAKKAKNQSNQKTSKFGLNHRKKSSQVVSTGYQNLGVDSQIKSPTRKKINKKNLPKSGIARNEVQQQFRRPPIALSSKKSKPHYHSHRRDYTSMLNLARNNDSAKIGKRLGKRLNSDSYHSSRPQPARALLLSDSGAENLGYSSADSRNRLRTLKNGEGLLSGNRAVLRRKTNLLNTEKDFLSPIKDGTGLVGKVKVAKQSNCLSEVITGSPSSWGHFRKKSFQGRRKRPWKEQKGALEPRGSSLRSDSRSLTRLASGGGLRDIKDFKEVKEARDGYRDGKMGFGGLSGLTGRSWKLGALVGSRSKSGPRRHLNGVFLGAKAKGGGFVAVSDVWGPQIARSSVSADKSSRDERIILEVPEPSKGVLSNVFLARKYDRPSGKRRKAKNDKKPKNRKKINFAKNRANEAINRARRQELNHSKHLHRNLTSRSPSEGKDFLSNPETQQVKLSTFLARVKGPGHRKASNQAPKASKTKAWNMHTFLSNLSRNSLLPTSRHGFEAGDDLSREVSLHQSHLHAYTRQNYSSVRFEANKSKFAIDDNSREKGDGVSSAEWGRGYGRALESRQLRISKKRQKKGQKMRFDKNCENLNFKAQTGVDQKKNTRFGQEKSTSSLRRASAGSKHQKKSKSPNPKKHQNQAKIAHKKSTDTIPGRPGTSLTDRGVGYIGLKSYTAKNSNLKKINFKRVQDETAKKKYESAVQRIDRVKKFLEKTDKMKRIRKLKRYRNSKVKGSSGALLDRSMRRRRGTGASGKDSGGEIRKGVGSGLKSSGGLNYGFRRHTHSSVRTTHSQAGGGVPGDVGKVSGRPVFELVEENESYRENRENDDFSGRRGRNEVDGGRREARRLDLGVLGVQNTGYLSSEAEV